MTVDALIMSAGAFVAVLPFLGFPILWDTVLMVIAGVLIISLGVIVRRRGLGKRPNTLKAQVRSYVESAPPSAPEHETA